MCSSELSNGKRDECEAQWRVKVTISIGLFEAGEQAVRKERYRAGFADPCCEGNPHRPFDVINGSNSMRIDQVQILEPDFRNMLQDSCSPCLDNLLRRHV